MHLHHQCKSKADHLDSLNLFKVTLPIFIKQIEALGQGQHTIKQGENPEKAI